MTVNRPATIDDEPCLEDWSRHNVIGGPGAFVMVAADYADFVAAIRRKLLQELTPGPIAGAPDSSAPPHASSRYQDNHPMHPNHASGVRSFIRFALATGVNIAFLDIECYFSLLNLEFARSDVTHHVIVH
jgi:hypothetical protein